MVFPKARALSVGPTDLANISALLKSLTQILALFHLFLEFHENMLNVINV